MCLCKYYRLEELVASQVLGQQQEQMMTMMVSLFQDCKDVV